MATVKILLTPYIQFRDRSNMLLAIRRDLNAGLYFPTPEIEVEGEGEDAAEDAFDLTNNPYRQEERIAKYGNGRSLSSGDIVDVGNDELWACLSVGWEKL